MVSSGIKKKISKKSLDICFQILKLKFCFQEPFVNTESENESNAEQSVDGRDSAVENQVTSLVNDWIGWFFVELDVRGD